MNLDRRNIERILFIGTALIIVYLGLQNMDVVFGFLNWLLKVLMPFIVAVCCTLFLNVPLKAIERHLFRPKNGKPVHPLKEKLRRPLALTMSIAIFILVIAAFLVVIIPEIGKSVKSLAEAVPGAMTSLQEWIDYMRTENEYVEMAMSNVQFDWNAASDYITGFLKNDAAVLIGYAMNMISSVFSVAVNVFLGIVLSVYTLSKKEKIASSVKKLLYSIMPMKTADAVVEVAKLTNKSFYNCITGQMMECVILGSLTALGMTIFQFPYAPLVGVMVAILSWIPMFGVYIGAGIGALLMLTSNPIDAIWFIVFMICLQQIEGNLIFPRVVGNNIGLPPIVLISAIVLFSNFFGIIGLLVSGAVTSVLYTLTRRFVFTRLRERRIPRYKYEEAVPYAHRPRVHNAKHNKGRLIKFNNPMRIKQKRDKEKTGEEKPEEGRKPEAGRKKGRQEIIR